MTTPRITKGTWTGAGAIFAVVVLIAAYIYASGGATRFASRVSPTRDEAVDFYSATRWQAWTHPGGDLIGHVGLRRIADGTTLATSPAFEMSGENLVIWDRDRVQVGSTAIYDRAGQRWTLVE